MFHRTINSLFNSHLGAKTVQSSIIRALNVSLSLVVSILLARSLGADGLGIYAGAMALVAILTVPATSGLPGGLVQMISRYLAAEQFDHARGMVRWGFGQVLGAGVIVSLVSAIFVIVLFPNEINKLEVYLLGFVILPIVCLTSVQRAILNGFALSTFSLIPQDIIRPGIFAALLLAWIIIKPVHVDHPATVMFIQFVSFVVAFIVGGFFLHNFGAKLLPKGKRIYDFRRWYRISFQFMLSGSAGLVLSQTDLLMLSWLEPPASAGLYRVASGTSMLIMLPFAAINVPLAPIIARHFQHKKMDECQRIVSSAVRWGFSASLVLGLTLIFAGRPLLIIVYGEEFVGAYFVLIVLVSAQLFHAAVGPVGVILDMTGHQLITAKGLAVAALVNVALNTALIPPFGPLGAAYATGASIILWNSILLRSVITKLNINPTILRRELSRIDQ